MNKSYYIVKLKKQNKIVVHGDEKFKFKLINLNNIQNIKKIDKKILFKDKTYADIFLDAYHNELLRQTSVLNRFYEAETVKLDVSIVNNNYSSKSLRVFHNKIIINNYDRLIVEDESEIERLRNKSKFQEPEILNPINYTDNEDLFSKLIKTPFVNNVYQIKQGREYHNIDHLIHGWSLLTEKEKKDLTIEQIYAFVFHDFIYQIGGISGDNETASSYAFEIYALKTKLKIDIFKTKQIILDTVDHKPSLEESNIILDLDLSYLGMDYQFFKESRKKIEKEYLTKYDHDTIRKETIVFMKNKLEEENLFNTARFKLLYQKKARENMRRYIEELK